MLKRIISLFFGGSLPNRYSNNISRMPPPPRNKRKVEVPKEDNKTATATLDELRGKCHVIDGDTILISGTKIRLAGIDAPELDHPWGRKSKYALISMCKGQVVTAQLRDELSYDRIVAKCVLPDGTDVAAELVKMGLALDWPKFSGGAYSHLEPPGIRRKLWRAAARQHGRFHGH